MLFLLFNVVMFVASLVLTYSSFTHASLFLSLPISLEILIVLGIATPIMNLKDTISNFIALFTLISNKGNEDED